MEDAIESQLKTGLTTPDHRQRLEVEADKYTNNKEKLDLLDNLYTHKREQESDILTEQRSQYRTDKATNNRLCRCNCGKVLESSNEKHLLCKDCFEKTKTNACTCGKGILPTRSCCFKVKVKISPMHGAMETWKISKGLMKPERKNHKLLKDNEALVVIEKVTKGYPTTWSPRMVMPVKKSGDLLRTVDLRKVNKASMGEPTILICHMTW